jgi:hypothetical protein
MLTDLIRPTVSLSEPAQFPDQYRATCLAWLQAYFSARRWEMQEWFGYQHLALLSDDDLSRTLIADQIASISRLAAAANWDAWVAGETYEAIKDLVEHIFCAPGDNFYHIPDEFWQTPFGAIVGQATFHARHEELITISAAAELLGVGLSAVSNRIDRGHLHAYRDPAEPNPTKARRVLRSEVLALKS